MPPLAHVDGVSGNHNGARKVFPAPQQLLRLAIS